MQINNCTFNNCNVTILNIDFNIVETIIMNNCAFTASQVRIENKAKQDDINNTVLGDAIMYKQLGSLQPLPTRQWYANQKEGNNPMYNNNLPLEIQQKNYLSDRARITYYDLCHKLQHQFHITDETPPTTLKDFKDRVAAGKFIIHSHKNEAIYPDDWDDDEDQMRWGCITDNIRWRDPAKKADQKGLDVAKKELEKKFTQTKDTIMVCEATEGLKVLQEFENWVPSNLPS